MDKSVTNENFPVDFKWTLKIPIIFLLTWGLFPIIFFLLPFFIFSSISKTTFQSGAPKVFIVIFYFFNFINLLIGSLILLFQILKRKNFGFSIEEDFFIFNQGIISKEQKNLPYGVIQNIIITQDILDRILGLHNLIIENAASSGGLMMAYKQNSKYPLSIGFYGNTAIIPGLTKDNSEELKKIILNKMKTKSFNDDRSGL